MRETTMRKLKKEHQAWKFEKQYPFAKLRDAFLAGYEAASNKLIGKTTELCPFCEQEVEIDAILDVHRCPNCQKVIVACSMCEDCKSDCYLEQEAKYLNGEK